jgi:hypothetical protein
VTKQWSTLGTVPQIHNRGFATAFEKLIEEYSRKCHRTRTPPNTPYVRNHTKSCIMNQYYAWRRSCHAIRRHYYC